MMHHRPQASQHGPELNDVTGYFLISGVSEILWKFYGGNVKSDTTLVFPQILDTGISMNTTHHHEDESAAEKLFHVEFAIVAISSFTED